MTEDVVTLGIGVDSTQVKDAKKSLDQLSDAGARTEKSLNSLLSSNKNLSESAKQSAQEAERYTSNLKRQADTIGMTSGQLRRYETDQQKFNDAQRASVDASNRTIDSYERKQVALGNLKMMAVGAAAAIGVALVAGLKASVTMAAEAEQSHLRLAAVLRGTGHAAGLTKGDLDAMADGLKEKLGIDDDALRDSMAVLLTFRNVSKESFGEALETSANLAAVMQTDLKSAVLQLGKALENPDEGLAALKRSGVSFNETQKYMIKGMVDSGNQAEAITFILKAMKEQGLDGVAEAMNSGVTKAIRDTGLAWDDFMKALGNTSAVKSVTEGFFSGLAGSLKDLRQAVESGDWMDLLVLSSTGVKTPSLIAKTTASAAIPDDQQARALADEGLARQKANQEAELAAIAKREADEEAAKAREEARKRAIAAAKSREEADKRAAQQAVDNSNRIIAALTLETEQVGKSVGQKRLLAAATEAAKAPTQELTMEIMASAQAFALATQKEEEFKQAEKDRLETIKEIEKAGKDAAKEAAKESAQQWNNMWGGVEQTAKASFIQFAAHGTGAMKSIGEAIKLSIIDVLYQLTVRKWMINVGASLQGSILTDAAGSATGSGFGNLLNIGSLGSGIKNGFGLSGLLGGTAGRFSNLGGAGTAFIGGPGTALGGSGMGGLSSLMGGAGGLSSMAGPLAALAASVGIGSMIAGDKKMFGMSGTTTAMIGAALGGPIGALIGGGINALFGHGPRKFRQEVAVGDVSAEGFDGRFTRVDRAKGGLIVGNKHWEYDSPQSSEFQMIFDTAIKGYAASAKDFAKNLGLNADAVTGFSKTIRLESEKGKALTEEQIKGFLQGISNEFAQGILPTVDTLKKAGEDSLATLGRLSNEFTTLSDAATILGKSVAESRVFISGASFEGRTGFVDNAGGIDALNQKASFFAQNFLSESERLAPSQEKLNDELKKLNLSTDLTKDKFRDLVQSFGKVNGVSEETLQSLLSLAPAFISVRDSVEAAAQAALGDSFTALQKSIDAERKKITDKFNSDFATVNSRIQSVNESISKLGLLSVSLKSTTDAINPQSLNNARGQIREAISGNILNSESLKQSLDTLSSQGAGSFVTLADFQRSQAQSVDLIDQLNSNTEDQLTLEERSLAALEANRDRLQAGFDNEMTRLDSIILQAQQQIDILNGIDTSIKSLGDALGRFNSDASALGGTGSVGSSNLSGGNSSISFGDIRSFSATHAPDEIYAAAKQYGVSQSQIVASGAFTDAQVNDYLMKKGLASFDVGGYVPKTGLAMIHKDEQVLSPGQQDSITSEIKQMRLELNAALAIIAGNTGEAAKILDNVSAGGSAFLTEAA